MHQFLHASLWHLPSAFGLTAGPMLEAIVCECAARCIWLGCESAQSVIFLNCTCKDALARKSQTQLQNCAGTEAQLQPQHAQPSPMSRESQQAQQQQLQQSQRPERPQPRQEGRDSQGRPRFTHFVSVPLNSEAQQAAFRQVKSDVVEQFSHTISDKAFIAAEKLHFTLCLLRAADAATLRTANATLRDCLPAIRDIAEQSGCIDCDKRFTVPLAPGLHTFPDRNVAKTKVLYQQPEPDSAAKRALRDMTARFIGALMEQDIICSTIEEQELHCTIVNVKYDKPPWRRRRKPKPFDASEVLAAFAGAPAATQCAVPALELSMLMAPPDADGYYRCALRLPFDENAEVFAREIKHDVVSDKRHRDESDADNAEATDAPS